MSATMATKSDLKMVPRADWGAASPVSEKPFEKGLPVFEVLLSLNAGLSECTDRESCIKSLQEGQKKAMATDNLPDIPYNFIIGPSGEVYEGRGWTIKPQKAIQMEGKDFHPVLYDIGFFGNYAKVKRDDPELPDIQFNALQALMAHGIYKKHMEAQFSYIPLHEPFEVVYRPARDENREIKPVVLTDPVEAKEEQSRGSRQGFTYTTSF